MRIEIAYKDSGHLFTIDVEVDQMKQAEQVARLLPSGKIVGQVIETIPFKKVGALTDLNKHQYKKRKE